MSYSLDPQYTIQKVAKQVFNKYELTGGDPFDLLIKEAKNERLTPELVTSLVHQLNNEIYLHHYKTASKGNPKTLNPQEVIKALSLEPQKVAGSNYKTDLSDFKPKVAIDTSDYKDYYASNTKRYVQSRVLEQDIANAKFAKADIDAQAYKVGLEIASSKRELESQLKLAFDRKEINNEEIFMLRATSDDPDLQQVFDKVITDKKIKFDSHKFTKFAETIKTVDYGSPIYKTMNRFIEKKSEFTNLYDGCTALEVADLRREGLKKLMRMSYGYLG